MLPHFLFAILSAAQVHSFPTGEVGEGKSRIVVVDRYRLPVPDAELVGVASAYGIRWLGATNSLHRRLRIESDANGLVEFPMDADETAWFIATRPGYAPSPCYPVHPGKAYEVTLDLGTTVYVQVKFENGELARDTELSLYWNPLTFFPGEDLGVARGEVPLARRRTDDLGWATFSHVPRGAFELQAYAGDYCGQAVFQVASAFGNEASFGVSPLPITIKKMTEKRFDLRGSDGRAITGATVTFALAQGLRPAKPREFRQSGSAIAVLADWKSVQAVTVHSPGFEDLVLNDMATGLVPERLAGNLTLQKRGVRKVEFSWLELGLEENAVLYTSTQEGADHAWTALRCDKAQERRYLEIADNIEVFGFAVVDAAVVGYLQSPSNGRAVALRKPGTLDISYLADGRPPTSAIVRLGPAPGSNALPPSAFFLTPSGVVTNPEGRAIVRGLFPGTYRIEPHFHHHRFDEYVTTVEVKEGETASVRVEFSRGVPLRGKVLLADGMQPIDVGAVKVVSLDDDVHVYKNDSYCTVEADGSFLLEGLAVGKKYRLVYVESEHSGEPWPGGLHGELDVVAPARDCRLVVKSEDSK